MIIVFFTEKRAKLEKTTVMLVNKAQHSRTQIAPYLVTVIEKVDDNFKLNFYMTKIFYINTF